MLMSLLDEQTGETITNPFGITNCHHYYFGEVKKIADYLCRQCHEDAQFSGYSYKVIDNLLIHILS